MNKQNFILIIGSLISLHALAMDAPQKPNKPTLHEIPSLLAITTKAIVAGYGNTNNIRQNNSAQLIIAMQEFHKNGSLIDSDIIESCKNRHIGTHGWGKKGRINRLKETQSHQLHTNFLIPYAPEKDLYLRNDNNKLCLLNIKTGKTEHTFGKTIGSSILNCSNITSDGIVISSSFSDNPITLWNTHIHQPPHSITEYQDTVLYLAAENNIFACVDCNNQLKIWDIATTTCTNTYAMAHHAAQSIMINNNVIYAGLFNGKIMIIDPRVPTAFHTNKAHASATTHLIPCKQNSLQFYSGSVDQTIKCWDMRSQKMHITHIQIPDNPTYGYDNIGNLHESNDGKRIFVTDQNYLYVFDTSNPEPQLIVSAWVNKRLTHHCIAMNQNETELYLQTYDDETSTLKTISPNYTFDELTRTYNEKK